MANIDDIQSPPQRPTPPPRPRQQYRLDSGALKGTRWLYDNEAEFRRAQQQVAVEEAREQAKKDHLKKIGLARAKRLIGKPAKKIKAARAKLSTAIRSHRKKVLIGGIAAVVALPLLFAFVLGLQAPKPPSTQVLSSEQPAAPSFDTLAPDDNIKQTVSGQIAFDKLKNVASYTDTIADTPVTVSQQQLPEPFRQNPLGELTKFAEQINAKEKLEIGDVTAYAGLSAKGPQTIVLIKSELLIFIAADKELPKPELIAYINSLK